jgi:NAD(P)-dependent dehydrogenase (short-subunit alcohol dehydrogenase family)
MNPSVSPAQIADAALSDGTHVELGLTDIEVLTIEHPEVPLSPNERSLPVEPGDLIVVSGGARGVTAAVGIEMAKRWQPTLLLLGRSTVDEREPDWAKGIADSGLSSAFANQAMKQGKKPSLKDLKVQVEALLRAREVRTAGATVTYVAVDVRDPESVHQAITAAVEQYGPVKGLVHGAGVLADKFIADKTAEQFDKVFQTKVDGLTVILNAISRENLKMLALFTSVAGRYGNRGQCDYAMANEALTRMGIEIAQQGVRVKAFDWGPWDGGMVNEGLSKQFKAAGIELIGLTDGAHFFCEEFEANDGNVEVIVGGPSVAGSLIQESNTGEITKNLEENEPYLRDHRIAGSPVLPAAMALEWIARAAQDAFPKLHFVGIRDFKVINGVILKSNQESLTLRWTQVPREEAQIGLRSFNCELISPNEKLNMPKVHYKGVVDLAIQQPQQRTFPGSNGLGANRYPYQVDEAYRRFLFHGPSLRGIQDIVGYSDHGMVARLNSSAPEQLGQPGGAWKTDPVAIDCALQMMLLWVREKYGNTALPSSVGEYRQYQAFVGPVTCHLVMDSTEAKQGSFHATFVSEDGMEVARFDSGRYVATPKRIAFGEA